MKIIIVWLIMLFPIFELVSRIVYGRWLDEYFLEDYFKKYWEKYDHLNPFSKSMFSGDAPYIAPHPFGLCKWHIEDIGQIPRWSKWHKKLNGLHNKLLIEGKY